MTPSRVPRPAGGVGSRARSRPLHPCPRCGKTFTKRSNMIIHERLHTGEMPYTCRFPGCGKKYKWLSSINFHENRCTLKNTATSPNDDNENDDAGNDCRDGPRTDSTGDKVPSQPSSMPNSSESAGSGSGTPHPQTASQSNAAPAQLKHKAGGASSSGAGRATRPSNVLNAVPASSIAQRASSALPPRKEPGFLNRGNSLTTTRKLEHQALAPVQGQALADARAQAQAQAHSEAQAQSQAQSQGQAQARAQSQNQAQAPSHAQTHLQAEAHSLSLAGSVGRKVLKRSGCGPSVPSQAGVSPPPCARKQGRTVNGERQNFAIPTDYPGSPESLLSSESFELGGLFSQGMLSLTGPNMCGQAPAAPHNLIGQHFNVPISPMTPPAAVTFAQQKAETLLDEFSLAGVDLFPGGGFVSHCESSAASQDGVLMGEVFGVVPSSVFPTDAELANDSLLF